MQLDTRHRAACPVCGTISLRHSAYTRSVVGTGGKHMVIRSSKHWCPICKRHFTAANPLVGKGKRYTEDVRRQVASMLCEKHMSLTTVATIMEIPVTTISDWRAARAAEEDRRRMLAKACVGGD